MFLDEPDHDGLRQPPARFGFSILYSAIAFRSVEMIVDIKIRRPFHFWLIGFLLVVICNAGCAPIDNGDPKRVVAVPPPNPPVFTGGSGSQARGGSSNESHSETSPTTQFTTIQVTHRTPEIEQEDTAPSLQPIQQMIDLDDPAWDFVAPEPQLIVRQWKPLPEIERQAREQQILPGKIPVGVDVASLVARTLVHSKRFKQLEIRPTESRQLINRELGVFDPTAFVRSQMDVENLQQRRENNQFDIGIRKNTIYGGSVEVGPGIGVQDNFAGPGFPDQGTSFVNILYRQELLRDGGKDVVLSRSLIASYRYDQQFAESISESNNLIQQTITAYWRLYRERANYYLQQALMEISESLFELIEDRSNAFERSTNSLEQARALFFEAKADLVDAETRVLQSQDVLFRLVNDPELDPRIVELVTAEGPTLGLPPPDPQEALAIAFQNRPELRERLAAIRENAVDLQVSLNQLLPKLSFSIRSSMNGFDDDRDFVGAVDNLGDLPMSGAAAINLEVLLYNRTAKARNKEAMLRTSRLLLEYEDQIEAIRQDVLVAVRSIGNAAPAIELRSLTLDSRQREVDAITSKIWVNPEEGVSIVLQLEQLFQAINRLVRTQQQLIEAQVTLQTSIVDLSRAKGVLISPTNIPSNIAIEASSPAEAFREWRKNTDEFEQERQTNLREPTQ